MILRQGKSLPSVFVAINYLKEDIFLPKSRIDYGDEATIVKSIDENLEFKKNMYLDGSTCLTLMVKHEDEDCVLKVRKKTNNVWDSKYFYYEIDALRRAKERNLIGVNRLIKSYEHATYQAILKPFIPGTPGNNMAEDFLEDIDIVNKLDKLYLRLHLAGISNINFLPRKIVFTEDGSITLVDLSTCLVNTEVGIQQFNQTMREDSQFITRLERNIKKKQKQLLKQANA